jgi:hypothetical protein
MSDVAGIYDNELRGSEVAAPSSSCSDVMSAIRRAAVWVKTTLWSDDQSGKLVDPVLRFGYLILVAVAVATLACGAVPIFQFARARGKHNGIEVIVSTINYVLLAFIVLELAETAREQLKSLDKRAGRFGLVDNLLVIGILSSVRHMLTIGAEIAAPTASTINPTVRLEELAVNIVAVVVLIGGLSIVKRLPGAGNRSADTTLDSSSR